MKIQGLQKTTLLDYPEKVACTVFTGGCNFRCPFCHNASLVLRESESTISEEEFFKLLSRRKGILDGVCITGGEPLLQSDILDFILKIKEMGFAVKLDTNGVLYDRLKKIISANAVDYIAMDIKNSPKKYALTAGIDKTPEAIFESIKLIMSCGIPYEFRTTVVKEYHAIDDIREAAQSISGAERYYLQSFTDSGDIIGSSLSAVSESDIKKMRDAALPFVEHCEIRGI